MTIFENVFPKVLIKPIANVIFSFPFCRPVLGIYIEHELKTMYTVTVTEYGLNGF